MLSGCVRVACRTDGRGGPEGPEGELDVGAMERQVRVAANFLFAVLAPRQGSLAGQARRCFCFY